MILRRASGLSPERIKQEAEESETEGSPRGEVRNSRRVLHGAPFCCLLVSGCLWCYNSKVVKPHCFQSYSVKNKEEIAQ